MVCGKRLLTIAVINAPLPPFKNGEHNSESVTNIDRVITPLIPDHYGLLLRMKVLFYKVRIEVSCELVSVFNSDRRTELVLNDSVTQWLILGHFALVSLGTTRQKAATLNDIQLYKSTKTIRTISPKRITFSPLITKIPLGISPYCLPT